MKLNRLTSIVLLTGLFACHNPKDKIVIQGKITGKIPEKIEYTNPVHGVCDWWFTQSVQPDSLGKFQILLSSEETIFIKIRTSYKEQGTLIAEPGKTYHVCFNLNNKENIFSVTGKSSAAQQAYNKFPDPEHIQLGAREFLADTVASKIKGIIEQRRASEIAEFEKLFSDKIISQEVFNLVKTDRNCYYDAILATIAWIKNFMILEGRGTFTKEFENLWKETFKQPLISNPELVKSPWFSSYAESYIYFQQYISGNFTKEKLEELRKSDHIKSYRVNNAKKYLPAGICEDYLADYLYRECFQKRYEKELIGLFNNFKTDYPGSEYIPYISPLVSEIIKFQKMTDSEFSEKIEFVKSYQKLNTLTEMANTFPKGKIYVDIWATWCGSCKTEFAYKEELKKLLQKNGIQMLYISLDRDKDSIQWKNMIKFYNLEGYHVRANKKLSTELTKIFDQNGSISIPWFLLISSDGKILKKHVKGPSQVNELEEEINEK